MVASTNLISKMFAFEHVF